MLSRSFSSLPPPHSPSPPPFRALEIAGQETYQPVFEGAAEARRCVQEDDHTPVATPARSQIPVSGFEQKRTRALATVQGLHHDAVRAASSSVSREQQKNRWSCSTRVANPNQKPTLIASSHRRLSPCPHAFYRQYHPQSPFLLAIASWDEWCRRAAAQPL